MRPTKGRFGELEELAGPAIFPCLRRRQFRDRNVLWVGHVSQLRCNGERPLELRA